MIESILIDQLKTETGHDAFVMVPDDMPGEFYIIDRTATSQANHIVTINCAVQSYAKSAARAAEMAEQAVACLEALADRDDFSKCEMYNLYMFTDTVRKRPRYQAMFEIIYYED